MFNLFVSILMLCSMACPVPNDKCIGTVTIGPATSPYAGEYFNLEVTLNMSQQCDHHAYYTKWKWRFGDGPVTQTFWLNESYNFQIYVPLEAQAELLFANVEVQCAWPGCYWSAEDGKSWIVCGPITDD